MGEPGGNVCVGAAHTRDVEQEVGTFDVAQKIVIQSDAVLCAVNQPRNVGYAYIAAALINQDSVLILCIFGALISGAISNGKKCPELNQTKTTLNKSSELTGCARRSFHTLATEKYDLSATR